MRPRHSTDLSMDYAFLELLRQGHPAWRLLGADNAVLVVSFLYREFVVSNRREIAQAELVEHLEDVLFDLRARLGEGAFPKNALYYLDYWVANEQGWLRKFYRSDSDEPYFDLTPSAEKAIAWVSTLGEREFVGTQSRLLTLFALLKQMQEGSETDPQVRLAELEERRHDIERQIQRIRAGDLPLLDDTEIRERFQQFQALARELLTDFRQVEQNFRKLDRQVRERIALWQGSKGELLEQIMGERDAIADSDQGKSFRAFWDFLMSSRRQEELSALLERVLSLPPVQALNPDGRTRRLHHDWLEAGEHTQRTVAQLSQQLRRFLDDQAWLENRRIMEILHSIEVGALAVRDHPEVMIALDGQMTIAETAARVVLPMEYPLYTPKVKPVIADVVQIPDEPDVDTSVLFSQVRIDTALLLRRIRQALQERSQITLGELCAQFPLEHGLAELIAYLQLATGDGLQTTIDETAEDDIPWAAADGSAKRARLPRIIFVR
jgi:hypothetical protein